MTEQQTFDFILDELLNRAVEDFQSTEEYKLLSEKRDRMYGDCNTMFAAEEKQFAEDCFSTLLAASGQEEKHVYRKGMRDCVAILKSLGVLA